MQTDSDDVAMQTGSGNIVRSGRLWLAWVIPLMLFWIIIADWLLRA
jgi:hypothetical protein